MRFSSATFTKKHLWRLVQLYDYQLSLTRSFWNPAKNLKVKLQVYIVGMVNDCRKIPNKCNKQHEIWKNLIIKTNHKNWNHEMVKTVRGRKILIKIVWCWLCKVVNWNEKKYYKYKFPVKMLNKLWDLNASSMLHEWMNIIKYLNLKTLSTLQNCLVSVFQRFFTTTTAHTISTWTCLLKSKAWGIKQAEFELNYATVLV